MKKTIKSLFAIAIAALTFAACSDVPEPYQIPNQDGQGSGTKEELTLGTEDAPLSIAQALAEFDKLADGGKSDVDAIVTGKISSIATNETNFATYKNINYYISADGTKNGKEIEVYKGMGLNNEEFSALTDIKVGDVVVVRGKLYKYVNKNSGAVIPEIENGYLVKPVNSTTIDDTPTPLNPDGMGTEEKPYDVISAIAAGDKTGVYVKGFIVGYAYSNQETKQTEWNFKAEGAQASNMLIAATADETDYTKCMPVNLVSGFDFRKALNLLDNPGNLGKEVLLYGNFTKYFSVQGVKDLSYAVFEGKEIGTKPGQTPAADGVVNVDFKTNNIGDWTISDKNKPEAIDALWKYNSIYGMVATAYTNNTNYDSESWLISPKYDLSSLTTATLTIHHAINFFSSIDVAKTQAVVSVSTDGTNWTDLTLEGWPSALGWTFFDSTADFSAYAGKKDVQIALKYISTAEKAGTWEVEKITVK